MTSGVILFAFTPSPRSPFFLLPPHRFLSLLATHIRDGKI